MCGRYVTPDTTSIQSWWKLPLISPDQFPFHYNTAPTLSVPVIHAIPERGNELCLARWGLIPHWWKDTNLPSFSFNARSEEAHAKPMWRDALQHSRCIMPAAGWYEWQVREGVDSKTGKPKPVKQPYFLFKPNEPVMGIAGLLSAWMSADGPVMTCALLTKAAPPALLEVHDRMPVILGRDECDQWLQPDLKKEAVIDLIQGSLTDFSFYAVSKAVNNARNNSSELIALVSN